MGRTRALIKHRFVKAPRGFALIAVYRDGDVAKLFFRKKRTKAVR